MQGLPVFKYERPVKSKYRGAAKSLKRSIAHRNERLILCARTLSFSETVSEWILIANVLVIYKKRQSVYLGVAERGRMVGGSENGRGGEGAGNMSSNLLR